MKLLLPLELALAGLKANKIRTLLTILGIVIGIAAVIIVLAAGRGLKSFLVDEMQSFGTDVIFTEPKVPDTSKYSGETAISSVGGSAVTTLKESDAIAAKKIPNVVDTYSMIMGQNFVVYQNQDKKSGLMGTNASFMNIDSSEIESGRFFTAEEEKSLTRVCVLGAGIQKALFQNENPLGKYVKIEHISFKVIGVMKERGPMAYMNMDDQIYLPLKTMQKTILGIDHILYFVAKVKDKSRIYETANDIEIVMRQRHDITDPVKDDFAVTTMNEALDMYDTVLNGVSLVLIAIAAISLLVGGVGIMNVMYVIVTERTKEIGLRKALGATYEQIMFQFLIEAVLITLIGGLIGVFIGSLVSWSISVIAQANGFVWEFGITYASVLTACGFCITIGLIFGIYPARKAAMLNPIEALRWE